jgi:hypothetical protein
MSNYKNLLKFGGVLSVLGLAALVYNFITMYDIVAKCPVSVKVQPCQAYDDWQLINQIGPIIVAVGIVFIIIGLVKRHYGKR